MILTLFLTPFLEVQKSYSEAAAYAILLIRTEWELPALAEDLLTGMRTVRARIGRAVMRLELQPELFDAVDRVDIAHLAIFVLTHCAADFSFRISSSYSCHALFCTSANSTDMATFTCSDISCEAIENFCPAGERRNSSVCCFSSVDKR